MWNAMLKRLGSQRAYLPVVVGLLGLTFVLTAVLAYQAQDADRRHREAAEAALADYTEMAAEAWKVSVQENLVNTLAGVYVQIRSGEGQATGWLPLAGGVAPEQLCPCLGPDDLLAEFSFDRLAGTVVFRKGGDAGLTEDALLEHIRNAQPAPINPGWAVHWLGMPGDSRGMIGLTGMRGADGGLDRGVGIVLTSSGFEKLLGLVFDHHPLLAGAQGPRPNSELFRARFSAPGFVALLGNSADLEGTVGGSSIEHKLTPAVGDFEVSLSLRGGAAEALIPGGMPQQRLPLLLALLVLTGMAVISAVFVLRREAELMKLRSDFVSSVSHELRTPLAQIRMFTETLLLGRVRSDLDRRRALEIIDHEARRLGQLVENVLSFSRTTRKRTRVEPEPTALHAEVDAALQAYAGFRGGRDGELRIEVQDGVIVPVDRNALRQILINLLDNAIKYGPQGQRITVGGALFGEAARLWVDDEGPGVPAGERDVVFESFHRLGRDVDRVTGSGIGLAVVRELVRLHGGRAWVEDAPGGGARVVAEFPGAYLRSADQRQDDDWAVA